MIYNQGEKILNSDKSKLTHKRVSKTSNQDECDVIKYNVYIRLLKEWLEIWGFSMQCEVKNKWSRCGPNSLSLIDRVTIFPKWLETVPVHAYYLRIIITYPAEAINYMNTIPRVDMWYDLPSFFSGKRISLLGKYSSYGIPVRLNPYTAATPLTPTLHRQAHASSLGNYYPISWTTV